MLFNVLEMMGHYSKYEREAENSSSRNILTFFHLCFDDLIYNILGRSKLRYDRWLYVDRKKRRKAEANRKRRTDPKEKKSVKMAKPKRDGAQINK